VDLVATLAYIFKFGCVKFQGRNSLAPGISSLKRNAFHTRGRESESSPALFTLGRRYALEPGPRCGPRRQVNILQTGRYSSRAEFLCCASGGVSFLSIATERQVASGKGMVKAGLFALIRTCYHKSAKEPLWRLR
jgi:hypothetical protein